MAYDNRRYLLIPTSITGSVDFNQVHETSAETLRLSVDGTQTFVKYEIDSRPDIYSEDYSEYTHSEILSILTGSEWTAPMDEEI